MKKFLASLLIWLALVAPAWAGTPEDLTLLGVGAGSDAAPSASYLVQEDGTSKFLLEGTTSTIAFDATSTGGEDNNSTVTFSHAVGAGSDRILMVGVSWRGTQNVNSVVFNSSENFTAVGAKTAGPNDNSVQQWYLLAPTNTTANVVVTMSAATNLIAGAMSFTGVAQSGTFGTQATASSNTGAPTVDVSSASGEMVFDTYGSDTTRTVGAGQTQRWNHDDGGGGDFFGGGSHEGGASTVTMSWTGGSDNWAIQAVPMKQSIVATTDAILLE